MYRWNSAEWSLRPAITYTPTRTGSWSVRGLSNSGDVLGFHIMELNQIKRFIKDLEERTDSLRRYL
jgi:hypothetical protein